MKNELEKNIEEYQRVLSQLEKLTTLKNELSVKIKEQLKNEEKNKYLTEDGIKAQLVESTKFTYNDETAIINYLKKNKLKSIYMIESIDAKKLNAELKKDGLLYDSLKTYLSKDTVESLRVGK